MNIVIYVNGNMENFKTELNSNEKLALQMGGMEGNSKIFAMNDESANTLLHQEYARAFNDKVDTLTDRFDKHNKAMENYAQSLSEDMNGVEIMPMFGYVLIKPFEQNPFQKVKVTNGIITDLGGFAPEYKSNETGETEIAEQYIKVGTVVEVGHKCEFLKPGDVVFYTVVSECMVPFYKMGFVVVSENRIIAVVNEKLTERRENLINGNKR